MSARTATVLRQNGWVVDLVLIAFAAYFVAGAANAVLGRAVRVVPSLDDAELAAPPPPPATTTRPSFHEIAGRNLLAIKREVVAATAEEVAPKMLTGRDFRESDLRPCTVPAVIRATLVCDENPEWSMAVVVPNTTREPMVLNIREGENAIAEDAFVVAIRSREIIVRRRDHFERCAGEGDVPGQATPTIYAAPSPAVGDDPASPTPGDMTGVTKLSETEYRIERAEVDRVLQNLNEVATQARIVPSFKNGKSNGFKLFSIKPGSIFSKIGLQNGDVIQKINGFDMNSPERALELYSKLSQATSLTIDIQRRGVALTLSYGIF